MEFEDWEPFYDRIRDDLGFSREEDLKGARLLDKKLQSRFDIERLENKIRNEKVWVVGNGPSLEGEASMIHTSDVVIAADAASRGLSELGIKPEVVCTDLDGDSGHEARLSGQEVIVAVHGHGDNRMLVRSWVDRFNYENTLGTTQTRPIGNLYNFGGFTDGDRCAFLADHFNASEIKLVGFDFDDPEVNKIKSKKLDWARKLLKQLAELRGEDFEEMLL